MASTEIVEHDKEVTQDSTAVDEDGHDEKDDSNEQSAQEGSFPIVEDDDQDTTKEGEETAGLDEALADVRFTEERQAIEIFFENKVKYPFVAQWRNPIISSIKENVIVKSVVQFNPYFGIIVVVEPYYELFGSKMTKKRRKMTVKDLKTSGYYAMACDLFGLKKKSLIGKVLDDHRKYLKRCVLVNETKAQLEAQDLDYIRGECEQKIPNINNLQGIFPNALRIRSIEDINMRQVVNKYQSHGGRPPQRNINKKMDVARTLELPDSNLRITYLCPMHAGCVNDLPNMIRYVTSCCIFPFEGKITARYSYLQEQQIVFTVSIQSVNYRCKQGLLFKGNVTSARIEPMEDKFKVERDIEESESEASDTEPRRKKRRISEEDIQSIETFNSKEVKIHASKLRVEESDSVNFKVLSDYQTWFCNSLLVDEKKIEDHWNSLRYYLQFIE